MDAPGVRVGVQLPGLRQYGIRMRGFVSLLQIRPLWYAFGLSPR